MENPTEHTTENDVEPGIRKWFNRVQGCGGGSLGLLGGSQ